MSRRHAFSLLASLTILGPAAAPAHQGGPHPTGLPLLEDAKLQLTWFYLYGPGVASRSAQDPFNPQIFTLINSSEPGDLPQAIVKIGWAIGDGHYSSYSDYIVTIRTNGRIETYPGHDLPSQFTINPLLDGWSGLFEVELRHQRCDLTLRAQAPWNLTPPACRECGTLQCQTRATIGSVDVDVPVAPAWFGTESVALAYHADTIVNRGPAGLAVRGRTGTLGAQVQKVANLIDSVACAGHLARVIACPTTSDPNAFEVHVSSDPLLPTQSVFRITRIENPPAQDGPASLLITETINGRATTRRFTNPAAGTWVLVENGLRRTTRSTLAEDGPARVRLIEVEELTPYLTWQIVSREEEHQTRFTWGWDTTKLVVDPGGRNLTTEWSYYDYGFDHPVTNRGRIRQIKYPTGLIRTFEYSTPPIHPDYQKLDIVREQFKDGASVRETRRHFKRTLDRRLERTETIIDDKLVARTDIETRYSGRNHWQTVSRYDGQSATPVVTRYEIESLPTTPIASRTIFPDGSIEEVHETFNPPLSTKFLYTRTTYTGTPNPDSYGLPVLKGRQTRIVIDEHAQIVQWEDAVLQGKSVRPTMAILPVSHDSLSRPTAYDVYHGGRDAPSYRGTIEYGCCGVAAVLGADRVPVRFYYDGLGRLYKTHRNGIAWETVFAGLATRHHSYPEAAPNSLPAATAANLIATELRDAAGLPVSLTTRSPADNSWITTSIDTSFQPASGIGHRQTITLPGVADDLGAPATITRDWFPDGLPAAVSGSLVANQVFDYQATPSGLVTISSLTDNDDAPRETTTTCHDWLGRASSIIFAGDADQDGQPDRIGIDYDSAGRPARITDPDGVATLFDYNIDDELLTTAVDVNRDGLINPADDQAAFERSGFGTDDSGDTTRWIEHGTIQPDGSRQVIQRVESACDGLASWIDDFPATGAAPTRTITTPAAGPPGSWDHTTWLPDGSSTLLTVRGGLPGELRRFDAQGNPLDTLGFTHDPWQRLTHISDPDGPDFSLQYLADQNDAVASETLGNHVTRYEYDHRGRVTALDLPDTTAADGSTVPNRRTASYWPHGGLRQLAGEPGAAMTFSWDHAQRLESLTTGGLDGPVTTWSYDPNRGWPIAQRHPGDGPTPDAGTHFTHTAAGRPKSRTDARGVTATLDYGPDGLPTGISYSDNTPGVSITGRDHQGRPTGLTDAGGASSIHYGPRGEIASVTHLAGHLMEGWSVGSPHDSLGRLASLSLTDSGGPRHQLDYGYDSAGRASSVESPSLAAHYHYLPGTRLVQQLAFSDPLGPVAYDTRRYDADHQLQRRTVHNGRLDSGFQQFADYQLERDPLGRLTRSTLGDATHWQFSYHPSGALAGADRHRSTGTLPGHSLRWDFDPRGNPTTFRRDPAPATPTTLLANPLDQLSSIARPGEFHIFGEAPPNHSVTVNGQPATRDGPFFHHRLTPANPDAPSSATIVVSSGDYSETGTALIPPSLFSPTYDAAGNLLGDGIFLFSWDAENRLRQAETSPAATAAGIPYSRISYIYDHQSRLVARHHHDSPSSSTPTQSTRFLHAGWRCLGELNANNQLTRSLAWGLDSASDLHLGDPNSSLLWIDDHLQNTHLVAHADTAGHLAGLIDSHSRQPAARYLHSPFGDTLAATGPAAKSNHWRFSSHFQDPDTSLVHFGHRWLDPATARWTSRDPLGESESPNLYAFVHNDPANHFDSLGGTTEGIGQAIKDNAGKITGAIGAIIAAGAAAGSGAFSTAPEAQAAAAEWGIDWQTGSVIGGTLGGAIGEPATLLLEECTENAATKRGLKKNDLLEQYAPIHHSFEDYLDRAASGARDGAVAGLIGTAVRPLASALRKVKAGKRPNLPIAGNGLRWVSDTPKGARPHPSSYLSVSERRAHEELFSNGVARIQSQPPTGTIGITETWVIPKSTAADLIRKADGSVSKLENLLGLKSGTLGKSPVLVDIANHTRYRIPTGNEFGANHLWQPGGYTIGGLPEAVIDPVQAGEYVALPIFSP